MDMDSNGSRITSDGDGDDFDKLDLSEISNEIDMKNVWEKFIKLEAELLAMKVKQEQNGNADQIGQEMKKEMDGMKKKIEEMAKKIEALEELKAENDGKSKEEYPNINLDMEGKKEDEELKLEEAKDEKNFAKDQQENGIQEKECGKKETEKNSQEIGEHNQLDSNKSVKMRAIIELLRRSVTKDELTTAQIIELGFINCLVNALSIQDEKIQYEAAWALTNIASGNSEQTWAIVEANGIEPLLKMCNSKSDKLAEQALWAIANIAGDGAKCRDELIARGVISVLVQLVKRMNSLKSTFVCNIAWTIQNLIRHKPQPSHEMLAQIAQPIAALLKYNGLDIKCKIDICWAIYYLTSGPDENIPLALEFIPDMVLFIKSNEEKLILPALHVIGNFATGNDELTQVVVDCGVLTDNFPQLMCSNNIKLVKNCCWIISNLLGGNEHQIQSVINAQLLPAIFTFLEKCDNLLQVDCGWAVANLAKMGNANQILEIYRSKNGIEAICNNLAAENNDELLKNMLKALHKTLNTIAELEPNLFTDACERVKKCDGLDKLMALKKKLESNEIAEMAQTILKKFSKKYEKEEME